MKDEATVESDRAGEGDRDRDLEGLVGWGVSNLWVALLVSGAGSGVSNFLVVLLESGVGSYSGAAPLPWSAGL